MQYQDQPSSKRDTRNLISPREIAVLIKKKGKLADSYFNISGPATETRTGHGRGETPQVTSNRNRC